MNQKLRKHVSSRFHVLRNLNRRTKLKGYWYPQHVEHVIHLMSVLEQQHSFGNKFIKKQPSKLDKGVLHFVSLDRWTEKSRPSESSHQVVRRKQSPGKHVQYLISAYKPECSTWEAFILSSHPGVW